jgi:lysophospholipase
MEKYSEVVDELNQRRLTVYSCDWRGQGLSDRMLDDGQKGHVASFEDYLNDLEQLMALMGRGEAPSPFILMGHSMGGHIAARFLERHPRFFDRVVMTAPMIDIRLPAFLPRFLLRWLVRQAVGKGLQGAYALGSGGFSARDRRFEGNPLTSDRGRFERNVAMIERNPRLAVGGVTYGWLAAALQSIDRLAASDFADSFPAPLLMVTAAEDRIVCGRAQARFCRHVPDCRMACIEGARHELLVETDARRARFWEAFDGFLAGL